MKSKKYLFLNSYRIIITLTLILIIYLIYNFSNNRFTIIEGILIKTDSNQAKDEIEKAAKKEEDKHKGDVMKNDKKYLDMHDRAF
jgi:amino acid permease